MLKTTAGAKGDVQLKCAIVVFGISKRTMREPWNGFSN